MDDRDKDKSPPEEGDGDGLWAYVTRSVRPLWREERALVDKVKAPKAGPAPRKAKKPDPAPLPEARAETFLDRLLHRNEQYLACQADDTKRLLQGAA